MKQNDCFLGHLESQHFDNHGTFLVELDKEVKRSQEIFIRHHVQKYEGKIPVWAAIEVLSFGALSKLYLDSQRIGSLC
ncbi:Abi family protein [Cohnella zeiphila]|uniref:Abi family protein n=1 Tax=Cohnella zeiphila TaxID=2761120 RepID=A0A7X0SQ47_9BACL|nr:Abi family protein [Cohnella zeiphila]